VKIQVGLKDRGKRLEKLRKVRIKEMEGGREGTQKDMI